MPRLARSVFPNIPHHITQRGNRREDVFFSDGDREKYLQWLYEYCDKHEVDILAYCLMTNHIHLVLRPTSEDGLQKVLKPLHMRYTQRINKTHGWKGHLWQGRYFSSALDDAHTLAAIRYVERNPLVAEMVKQAETFPWSSAAVHCGIDKNRKLISLREFGAVSKKKWSGWLAGTDDQKTIELTSIITRNIEKGFPCGSDEFIEKLEKKAGVSLRFRPQGRPADK